MARGMAIPDTLIHGLTREEVEAVCREMGQPAFRARQLWRWLQLPRIQLHLCLGPVYCVTTQGQEIGNLFGVGLAALRMRESKFGRADQRWLVNEVPLLVRIRPHCPLPVLGQLGQGYPE